MSRVVVVTGASSGVGRGVAIEFARQGAAVGLLARGRGGLEGARRDIEAAGGTARVIPVDVADADDVEAAAEQVESELGPIDTWVNNAMVTVVSPFTQMTNDEFRRVTEVTYLGTVHGTLAALRRMVPQNRGVVVQVGSALAYRGIPLQSAYCGAKHAIQGFTESVRCELLHEGSAVKLTMVQLPALNTPQFDHCRTRMPCEPQPVPPIYQPEIAARAVAWAADHSRRELYVGETTVITILGDKLAPGLGDRYLGRTGYDAQQTAEPVDPDRRDNLFESLGDDPGVHGRFDAGAHAHSPQAWLSRHRGGVALAAASAALAELGRRASR